MRFSTPIGQRRNQGEAAFGVVPLTQVHGTVRQHHLECGASVNLQQMARDRPSAATTENTMDMQRRLIIRRVGDIASKGGDLDLFIDWDALVFLGLPVEIAENSRTESANGAELCRFDLFLLDEALQARHHFISAVEHNDKTAMLSRLIDQFRLHGTRLIDVYERRR